MTVHILDPLTDPRWAEFVDRHEAASVFHSVPWLEAIRRTYGYKPVVYTTSPPSAPLTNGVALCEVRSWLTGRRLVSLPFSDHCEPLFDSEDSAAEISLQFEQAVKAGKWKYVEVRPQSERAAFGGSVAEPSNFLHMLDITPKVEDLFQATHKTAVRGTVKRAEREGLRHECGNSDAQIREFYRLLVPTRRRHLVPPQPLEWFTNLAASMGDRMKVHLAYNGARAVTAVVMLHHKSTVVYKYAASDNDFNNLGGTPFLVWKSILEAKEAGLTCMDFGRSDADNPGLIAFKDRWGTKSSRLTYLRWSLDPTPREAPHRSSGRMKRLIALMPDAVLEATGRILYRHVG